MLEWLKFSPWEEEQRSCTIITTLMVRESLEPRDLGREDPWLQGLCWCWDYLPPPPTSSSTHQEASVRLIEPRNQSQHISRIVRIGTFTFINRSLTFKHYCLPVSSKTLPGCGFNKEIVSSSSVHPTTIYLQHLILSMLSWTVPSIQPCITISSVPGWYTEAVAEAANNTDDDDDCRVNTDLRW